MIISHQDIDLIDGTPAGIKAYRAIRETAHYHKNCIEILFCLRGSAHIKIAYEDFELEEGDLILIDAEDVHCISSDNYNVLISFYIDQTSKIFGDKFLVNMSFVCHKGEVHPSMELKIDYINILLLTLLQVHISDKYSPGEKISLISDTARTVMEIIQRDFSIFYWMNNPDQFPDDAKERFEHIFTHIYTNSRSPMTIKELGKLEHINPNYLSQFLKKTSFMGLRGLRTYVRVYKAELLLLTTDMKVTDISYQCGFSDPKYFYRAFKKWYGHTPLNHRKFYREYMEHVVPGEEFNLNDITEDLIGWIAYYQSELQLKLSGIK